MSNHTLVARWLERLLIALLVAGAAISIARLGQEVLFEWNLGPMGFDSVFFWTVGRGIVNGLVPYKDLFETKPPGIFLLSAFFLRATGGTSAAYATQAVVTLLAALSFAPYSWWLFREAARVDRLKIVLLSLIFGIQLQLYVAKSAGHYIPESFGVFAGMLFAMLVAHGEGRRQGIHVLLAGLCLFLAIGMKEPFILSFLAAAILLSDNVRSFIRDFACPVLVGSILFAVVLLGTRYAGPYAHLYLAHMFGAHIGRNGPVLLRGLDIGRVLSDLQGYSVFLKWIVVFLATSFVWQKRRWHFTNNVKHLSLALGIALLCLFDLSTEVFRFHQLLRGIVRPTSLHLALLRWTALAQFPLLAAVLGIAAHLVFHDLARSERTAFLRSLAVLLAALSLMTLAVGMGGDYSPHHFLFAVPVYIALYLLFLRRSRVRQSNLAWTTLSALVIGLAIFTGPIYEYADKSREQEAMTARHVHSAAVVDRMLDQCHLSRYLLLGTSPEFFTQHSPLGPLFWQRNIMDIPGSALAGSVMDNLRVADVVVSQGLPPLNELEKERATYVRQHFTETPWPCALPLQPIPPYTILFRNHTRGGEGGNPAPTVGPEDDQ